MGQLPMNIEADIYQLATEQPEAVMDLEAAITEIVQAALAIERREIQQALHESKASAGRHPDGCGVCEEFDQWLVERIG